MKIFGFNVGSDAVNMRTVRYIVFDIMIVSSIMTEFYFFKLTMAWINLD